MSETQGTVENGGAWPTVSEAAAALRELIRAQPKRLAAAEDSTVEFDRTSGR